MPRKLWRLTKICAVLAVIMASCAPAAAPVPDAATPPGPTAAASVRPSSPPAEASAKPAAPAATPLPTAGQARYGGVLAISAQGDPYSLDMHQEGTFLTENVIQCAYNNITQLNPNNPSEVIGDLARSWDISKDGLTYTFHLHESVKFHDGGPLTPEDVQFSFERMVRPPRGISSPRRADLAALDRIEVAGTNSVSFVLKYPSGAFLDVISNGYMVVYSRAFVEKKGHMRNDVMGTGPYMLRKYSPGSSLEYVKNTDYFIKGRPHLDGITFYIIKDASTRLAAFRAGRVKLTGPGTSGLTASDAEAIKRTMPQAVLMPYPAFSRRDILMNNQRKPWDDVRVRKAVHLAIDRQTAISVLEQGYGDVGTNFPDPWGIPRDELVKMPGWRQPKDQDIADARKLLAEAGYPDGFTATCLVRSDKQFQDLAVYVVAQMAKIGIKLEMDVKDPTVRAEMCEKGMYEFHPRIASLSFPDPENVVRYWARPAGDDWGSNWARYSDQQSWDLFDRQSRAIDPAERKRIVRELDLRLIETAGTPVIFWTNAIIGMWPEVRDRGKLSGFFSFQKYQDIWLAS